MAKSSNIKNLTVKKALKRDLEAFQRASPAVAWGFWTESLEAENWYFRHRILGTVRTLADPPMRADELMETMLLSEYMKSEGLTVGQYRDADLSDPEKGKTEVVLVRTDVDHETPEAHFRAMRRVDIQTVESLGLVLSIKPSLCNVRALCTAEPGDVIPRYVARVEDSVVFLEGYGDGSGLDSSMFGYCSARLLALRPEMPRIRNQVTTAQHDVMSAHATGEWSVPEFVSLMSKCAEEDPFADPAAVRVTGFDAIIKNPLYEEAVLDFLRFCLENDEAKASLRPWIPPGPSEGDLGHDEQGNIRLEAEGWESEPLIINWRLHQLLGLGASIPQADQIRALIDDVLALAPQDVNDAKAESMDPGPWKDAPKEVVLALRAVYGSFSKASKATGVPASTIKSRVMRITDLCENETPSEARIQLHHWLQEYRDVVDPRLIAYLVREHPGQLDET